jgi:hypothetical protein
MVTRVVHDGKQKVIVRATILLGSILVQLTPMPLEKFFEREVVRYYFFSVRAKKSLIFFHASAVSLAL